MRTAQSYMQSVVIIALDNVEKKKIAEAINEARKEAIMECAEVAEVEYCGLESSGYETVNKQSILDLIKELK